MELETHKAALHAAPELPVVIQVRVEPKEGYEIGWERLVSVPDDIVRARVVVAGVRVIQGKDDALLHPCSLHAVAHTVSGHRPALDVVLHLQSDRRSRTNSREMLPGGVRRC